MEGSKYKDFFTRIDEQHVRCDLCWADNETVRLYKLKTGSSTSCLRGHLLKIHNTEVPNTPRSRPSDDTKPSPKKRKTNNLTNKLWIVWKREDCAGNGVDLFRDSKLPDNANADILGIFKDKQNARNRIVAWMDTILGLTPESVAWVNNETLITAFVSGKEAGCTDIVSDQGNIVVTAELRDIE